MFDVGTLLEDAETKTAALERVEELEENLNTVRQGIMDLLYPERSLCLWTGKQV